MSWSIKDYEDNITKILDGYIPFEAKVYDEVQNSDYEQILYNLHNLLDDNSLEHYITIGHQHSTYPFIVVALDNVEMVDKYIHRYRVRFEIYDLTQDGVYTLGSEIETMLNEEDSISKLNEIFQYNDKDNYYSIKMYFNIIPEITWNVLDRVEIGKL
jgi:hypothetical protein